MRKQSQRWPNLAEGGEMRAPRITVHGAVVNKATAIPERKETLLVVGWSDWLKSCVVGSPGQLDRGCPVSMLQARLKPMFHQDFHVSVNP